MKTFNYFFVLIFILFAVVQYNDPDPYLWIPIYLYPAYLCFKEARAAIVNPYFYYVGFTGFGLYAIYKLFDQNGIIDWIQLHDAASIASTMKAEQPWVEESREFFGLVIILTVMAINYKRKKAITK